MLYWHLLDIGGSMNKFSIRFEPGTAEMVVVRPVDGTTNQVVFRTTDIEDIFDHIMVSKYETDTEIYNEFG